MAASSAARVVERTEDATLERILDSPPKTATGLVRGH
jgi:hypothetical protein